MKLVDSSITIKELRKMSDRMFGGLVKAVVDIEKEIMVVDAAMHADEETLLLKKGSKQENLWGINFYPNEKGDDFLEYDSMINIRPNQNNMSNTIQDEKLRKKIRKIVEKLITDPESSSG